jgi:hypothetical protein
LRRRFWRTFRWFAVGGLGAQVLIVWAYYVGPRDEYGYLWRTPPVEFLIGVVDWSLAQLHVGRAAADVADRPGSGR